MLKILQINILPIIKNNFDIYLFGYRHLPVILIILSIYKFCAIKFVLLVKGPCVARFYYNLIINILFEKQ